MILAIARRELRSLFLSPLAWTILAVVEFILAWLFLSQLQTYLDWAPRLAGIEDAPGVTDLVVAPVLGNAAVVLLLVVPLITMRTLAEERRARTLTLLFSSPISMTQIVLGKYLGLLGFFTLMLLVIALIPLSLLLGIHLDLGKLAAGLLGLELILGAFAAIGLFISCLTSQPGVAAVGTFGALLLLWILDWAGAADTRASGLMHYLSLLRHYESLLKGLFSSTDVAYYLLVIVTFLVLAVQRLDAQRLPH